jgi:mono/diheme cytochrome c family protein
MRSLLFTRLFSRSVMRRLALLVLTVSSAATTYADDSSFTSTAGIGAVSGEEIYSHICQGCHMPQGQGAIGAGYYPKLAGDSSLVSWQYVALIVLRGKDGMPPFGLPADQVQETRTVHLSDAQIADVVNYLRSHFGNAYKDKVTATQIATLPHPGTVTAP